MTRKIWVFDREAFEKNAPANTKKQLPDAHREGLHGTEVEFDGEDIGESMDYQVEGEPHENEYFLYPVSREWCREIVI